MIMHQRVALVAICLLLITGILQARQLASDTFTFRDAAQQPIMVLNDGKLESACTLTTKDRQHPATVTIDLQTPHLLHRVYWCGNKDYIGQDTPPGQTGR